MTKNILLWLLILSSFSLFAAVQNLEVIHKNGQTFISWDENGAEKYQVYRNISPITVPALVTDNIRITVDSGFAKNSVMSSLSDGSSGFGNSNWPSLSPPCIIRRNVITPLDPDSSGLAQTVPAGRNLIVINTRENGTYYYAVTAVTGSMEDKTLAATSTAGPVNETIDEPHAYLIWQSTTMKARIYLQYTDIDSINSKKYAWPYWVGSRYQSVTQDTCRLVIHLAGGDQRMTGCRDSLTEWELYHYFYDFMVMPSEIWELWYGHSATFDPNSSSIPTSGPIVNFTQARVMGFLRYMIYDDPFYSKMIDTNRINVTGSSNGGCGALQFYYNYPNVFATAKSTCGPSDITRYGSTYNWYFGDYADSSLRVSFRGWKSEYLRDNFEGTQNGFWFDLDSFVLQNEGADLPFLYIGYGGSDQTIDWPKYGREYITNLHTSRRAFCGGLDGPADHNGPSISPVAQWNTIRLNNAYPSFTTVSGNPAIPLPASPEMIKYEINNQFMWSTPFWRVGGYQNQVDETNRFEMVIASSDGDQTGDITPRRLQNFRVQSGEDYIVKNTAVNDTATVYQIDTIAADQYGLVTFTDFEIKAGNQSSGGSRFIMVPVVPYSRNEDMSDANDKMAIICTPNPFNPAVVINVGATKNDVGNKVILSPLHHLAIYNTNGRIVTDLTPYISDNRIIWNANNQPSGIYIIRARIGKKTLAKQITLLK